MTTKLDDYNLASSVLSQIAVNPKIASITYSNGTTAVSPAGGDVVVLTGSGFRSGIQVHVGLKLASQVTLDSETQLTITTPSNNSGNQWLTVTNSDGTTARLFTGIQYSGVPAWTTAAGSLGSFYETKSSTITVSATSDSTISYAVTSGALPSGLTLNSSSGAITGNFPLAASDTQYNFTITATDTENQKTDRNFSITVLTDVVTWITPTYQQVLDYTISVSMSLTLSATSASENTITYGVTGLPAGISYSNGVISGTPTTMAADPVTITATIANTNRVRTNVITFNVNPSPGQIEYTSAGTYTWTAPAGVTKVSVVCVGGGGTTGQTATSGGGGGGLGWKNNITVVPGTGYTVVVGAPGTQNATTEPAAKGGDSYFINSSTVAGLGGNGSLSSPTYPSGTVAVGGIGGSYVGDGGGNGGDGGGACFQFADMYTGGGGGAGGYTGRGGHGQQGYVQGVSSANQNPAVGSGGGGGGGAGGLGDTNGNGNFGGSGGGGGGVGILGKGSDGVAGVNGNGLATGGNGATGGSGGGNGTNGLGGFLTACGGGSGGQYGAGASSGVNAGSSGAVAGTAGGGAVRIIWGTGRSFPSTNTGNV